MYGELISLDKSVTISHFKGLNEKIIKKLINSDLKKKNWLTKYRSTYYLFLIYFIGIMYTRDGDV